MKTEDEERLCQAMSPNDEPCDFPATVHCPAFAAERLTVSGATKCMTWAKISWSFATCLGGRGSRELLTSSSSSSCGSMGWRRSFILALYSAGGSPVPTATQMEPLRNHGQVVYIAHSQSVLVHFLLTVMGIGISSAMVAAFILHYLLGCEAVCQRSCVRNTNEINLSS